MKTSRVGMIYSLYKKELVAAKNELLMIMTFILGANAFLFYKHQTGWPVEASFIFSLFLLLFVVATTFFRAFSVVRNEWKENTVYLVMSLPITGVDVFLSKLLALLTQLIGLSIIALIGASLFIPIIPEVSYVLEQIQMEFTSVRLIWNALKIGLLGILGMNQAIIFAFFSAVVGKLFKKFSGLITLITFIGISMINSKFIDWIGNFFIDQGMGERIESQLMGLDVTMMTAMETMLNVYTLLFTIITVVTSAGVFFATAALYDRKVEL
ncbi:conserved hypothetical protein [Alkaliphilus metalliredigens QYMF]|uniref:ABC transporter, permease protein n=1 Tax=Alkaliphilus metalliredigens (strain QYMF) TaxID=293826 RepID=A6TJK5_ALKMQ|nr:hypothetical protein [Alkaliphilus metalliredigens]ABR46373.1 conserved hypothetical protein [Alkaliphilus metalliredigens QYMF]